MKRQFHSSVPITQSGWEGMYSVTSQIKWETRLSAFEKRAHLHHARIWLVYWWSAQLPANLGLVEEKCRLICITEATHRAWHRPPPLQPPPDTTKYVYAELVWMPTTSALNPRPSDFTWGVSGSRFTVASTRIEFSRTHTWVGLNPRLLIIMRFLDRCQTRELQSWHLPNYHFFIPSESTLLMSNKF